METQFFGSPVVKDIACSFKGDLFCLFFAKGFTKLH